MLWRIAADVVLIVHLAFVAFVVVGGLLACRWPRAAYVQLPVALYGVVIELIGFRCPLTPLEKTLRRKAGDVGFEGGFVEHYIVPVLYPGEFTTGTKIALAGVVVAVNVIVYAVLATRMVRGDGRR